MIINRQRVSAATIQWLFEVEKTLDFQNTMSHCLQKAAVDRLIDPLSFAVADKVDRLARTHALIQAAYALRFSEVFALNMGAMAFGRPQEMVQTKVFQHRYLAPFPSWDESMSSSYFPPLRTMFVDRQSYANQLDKMVPVEVKRHLIDCMDKTHVFRHFRASWMIARGYTMAQVQKFFAHAEESSTRCYVHDGLINYFQNLN